MMVREGKKRSLNVAIDFTDNKQRLEGYKTLNLINCSGDASFMSAVLYSHIARQYMPAPKANFVRVVINGESWGLYANIQQFNKDFIQENYRTSKGARWKVKGSPGGQSGLDYVGEELADAFVVPCVDQLRVAVQQVLDAPPGVVHPWEASPRVRRGSFRRPPAPARGPTRPNDLFGRHRWPRSVAAP